VSPGIVQKPPTQNPEQQSSGRVQAASIGWQL
jgi:hypothetical protein